MNHQPYETWILEEQDITPLQKKELLEHTKNCPKCASFEKYWGTARQEIMSMPEVNAPVGFSSRWHSRLEMRRKIHERQQARVLLISLVSSAVAILITLGIFVLPHASLISLMVNLVTEFIQLVNSLTQLWEFLSGILKAAPPSFLIGMGLILSLFISLVSLTWAFSFYRITVKGIKVSNEK